MERFEQVQRIIDIERPGGTRECVHDHYLKALLWCGRCQRRLVVMPGKSQNDNQYFYYLCWGRQGHLCDLPYLPVEKIETEVARHYRTVQLTEDFRAFLRYKIDSILADSKTARSQIRSQLTKRLNELVAPKIILRPGGQPHLAASQARHSHDRRLRGEDKIEEQLRRASVRLDAGCETILTMFELLTETARVVAPVVTAHRQLTAIVGYRRERHRSCERHRSGPTIPDRPA